jgi:hypothetical protein
MRTNICEPTHGHANILNIRCISNTEITHTEDFK